MGLNGQRVTVTVTLNPSLDRTVELPRLAVGEVLRATGGHLHPGGKGVNVARALLANGRRAVAVLPAGGAVGAQLATLLSDEGVESVVVPIAGQTRSNVTVAETDGTVTKINEPGPRLAQDELESVVGAAVDAAGPGSWVVLCGSLPAGAAPDTYALIVRRLRDRGVRVAVDTSGPALVEAVAAGPDLVKPNAEELAEAVGRELASRADVIAAARELRDAGAGQVLVSLGADGAVLVGDEVLVGTSVAAVPRSTVGAGDAFLAGYLAAHDDGPRAALASALAWGAAAVQLPGTQMPGPSDIDPATATVLPDDQTDELLPQPLVGA